MLKIQIVNRTGKPYDTFIYNADTGETLGGIAEIGPMSPSEMMDVKIVVNMAQLDLYSEHVQIVTECPHCNSRILLKAKEEK